MITKNQAILLAICLALIALMPSSDSIWVDEAQTWRYARAESFSTFWRTFTTDGYSEAQMPLGMLAFWSGAQVFGQSELGLRAINLIWAVGAVFVFSVLGSRTKLPFLPLFLAIQPFLWFYVNEARPYAMQIFGGSLLLLALHRACTEPARSMQIIVLWGFGSLITAGASMLGAISVVAVTLLLVFCLWRSRAFPTFGGVLTAAAFVIPLGALGIYYLTTLLRGAGGAKIWEMGFQNLLFSAVELAGVSGLLPSRQIMRELVRHGGWQQLDWAPMLPGLLGICILGVFFAALAIWWVKNLRATPSWITFSVGCIAGTLVMLFVAAYVVGFPFWGRHLAPIFPFYAAILGWLTAGLLKEPGKLSRVIAFFGCVALLASALSLRFSPIHAKDDYRSAAAEARQVLDQGGVVWWAADPAAAEYYGLPWMEKGGLQGWSASPGGKIVLVANSSEQKLLELPPPRLVVLSKPDIYDVSGQIKTWLRAAGYFSSEGIASFSLWSKTQPTEQ